MGEGEALRGSREMRAGVLQRDRCSWCYPRGQTRVAVSEPSSPVQCTNSAFTSPPVFPIFGTSLRCSGHPGEWKGDSGGCGEPAACSVGRMAGVAEGSRHRGLEPEETAGPKHPSKPAKPLSRAS